MERADFALISLTSRPTLGGVISSAPRKWRCWGEATTRVSLVGNLVLSVGWMKVAKGRLHVRDIPYAQRA